MMPAKELTVDDGVGVLKKFYRALIDAIALHAKIEKLVRQYNELILKDVKIKKQLVVLSQKLDFLMLKINQYKKAAENKN